MDNTDHDLELALALSISQAHFENEAKPEDANFHAETNSRSHSNLSTPFQKSAKRKPSVKNSFLSERSRDRTDQLTVEEVEAQCDNQESRDIQLNDCAIHPQACFRPIARDNEELFEELTKASRATQPKTPKKAPRKLLPVQKQALYFARRLLFSTLSGDDEPRKTDPPDLDTPGFNTYRISQVLKHLGISATTDEINAMMLFCRDPNLAQCEHHNSFRGGFCEECWKSQQDHKAYEPFEQWETKHKQTKTLTNIVCNWQQFCWIFDFCDFKAEKNGVVW